MARYWRILVAASLTCTFVGCQQPLLESLHPSNVLHELRPPVEKEPEPAARHESLFLGPGRETTERTTR